MDAGIGNIFVTNVDEFTDEVTVKRKRSGGRIAGTVIRLTEMVCRLMNPRNDCAADVTYL